MTLRQDRRLALGGLAATALSAALPGVARGQAAWPNRPVTLVCPWGAGGGTDATARIVAAILEKNLGQPFNVVNRTGGSGVVGHSAIATAPPDGYTLGMITVEITMMHHQGLTELNPTSYTPLALMNVDPPGVQVNSRLALQDDQGTGRRHQGRAGRQVQGIGHRPGRHLAPGADRLAAGHGAEARPCGLGAVQRRRARHAGPGRRRHRHRHLLGARGQGDDRRRQGGQPGGDGAAAQPAIRQDVPTLNESLGINYSVGAWRGIAAPKGLPADIATKLTAELKKAYDSPEFQDFMKQPRLRHHLGRPGRVQQVHGRRRQGHGRRDGGRRLAKKLPARRHGRARLAPARQIAGPAVSRAWACCCSRSR
jgi:tripartite-type tricarboxylate transporter receptor subunit TctC